MQLSTMTEKLTKLKNEALLKLSIIFYILNYFQIMYTLFIQLINVKLPTIIGILY